MKRPLALLFVVACTPPAAPTTPSDVAIVVPKPPALARWDGRRHLMWELVVTNPSANVLTVESIEIDGDTFGKKRFTEGELRARVKPVAPVDADRLPDLRAIGKPPKAGPSEIPAESAGAIFLRLQSEDDIELPKSIRQVVTLSDGHASIVRTIDVVPSRDAELVIDAPLRGAGWVGVDGPSDLSAHRRRIVRTQGGWHVGQRFAIDWTRVGADGNMLQPNAPSTENGSYLAYDAPVLAVADGTVEAVHDGVAENAGDKGFPDRQPMTMDAFSGNAVVLDLGGGRFAGYAQLQPGSIRVRRGDRVRTGDVIAKVGNSGSSDLPHLHFQVCDAPSFLACDGVPWVIRSFEHTPLGDDGIAIGKPAHAERELVWSRHATDFGPRVADK